MKRFLLSVFTLISFYGFAQEVVMQNGSITTCSGIFTDSGGEFGDYSDNEDFILTICPDGPGKRIRLNFQEFATQSSADKMTIYNGDSSDESFIFGVFDGSNGPGQITATLENPTGCLTIRFESNGSDNTTGWSANISCLEPCQIITSQLNSTVPLPNSEGVIQVCINENITLNGGGNFEYDGTGAVYEWDFGNGTFMNGQSVTFSYDLPGIYIVNLNIRDDNTYINPLGCSNSNFINQIIHVSGEPNFEGTEALNDSICYGGSTTIEGVVNPISITYDCIPPVSEMTFLPDGLAINASLSSIISVDCFESGALLTDITQLEDVCINIEHSYSGDLDIKIISPNGQEAILFEQGGGGTYFGGANDDNSNDPGVGADYCFSMNASTLLEDANTILAGTNPPRQSWEPGTYLPVQSFDALIGSPLNGLWRLEIIDNFALDNGYLFSWEINFDPSLPRLESSFEASIVSQSWDTDPTITNVSGNTITVAPSNSGTFCYTYRTVDVFGCEYSEVVCINVADENEPPVTYYEDNDGDGFGDPDSPSVECSPTPPNGFVTNNLDCDDSDDTLNPDAIDTEGNGIDENCDGVDGDALGVDEFAAHNFKISPNPFKNEFTIHLPFSLNSTLFNVEIYDVNGRIVYKTKLSSNNGSIKIDKLNNLDIAPYFLKISNKENELTVVKKLIKL